MQAQSSIHEGQNLAIHGFEVLLLCSHFFTHATHTVHSPRLFLCFKIPHVHALAQISSITFIYILFCIIHPYPHPDFLVQNWPQNAL